MTRFLLPLGIALVALIALAAAVGVLAYGTEAPRDGAHEIPGLDSEVGVAWDDSGRVWVEGPDEIAIATGLGYAHAADQGWAAALWRQAASGTLAEWFGEDARAADLHARTMGFEALARLTYEALSDDERAILDAYARGISAGLAEPGVAQGDPFLVADVVPGAWRPWDALAVERLHAYLAAPALSRDSTWTQAAAADPVVARFLTSDSTFRAALAASGGGYDRVYALPADSLSGGDPALVQQLSFGASALPLLAPAVLTTPQGSSVALTIPGTLVSPGGWSGGLGWGMLLGTPLRLERYAGTKPPTVYSRIVDRNGDETLLEVARDTSGLVLRAGADTRRPASADSLVASDSTAVSDSTATGMGWRVAWRGFRLGTDLGAFRTLRAGRVPPRFTILDGDGLAATVGDRRALGAPLVSATAGGVALVAQDSLVRSAVLALSADSTSADSLLRPIAPVDGDVASEWARSQLRALVEGLGSRDSLADVLKVPYGYLNGWDGAYRPDGIAPSLFEWWLWSHRDYTGHLPDPTDSLDVALLPATLRIARAELRDRYGPLPTDWRWGEVQGRPVYPVLGTRRVAAGRRYRQPVGPPGGHPTSARPGPSLVIRGPQPGRAVWSASTDLRTGVLRLTAPSDRPANPGAIALDQDARGRALVIDPRTAMPADRLILRPAG